eukprot:gene5821-8027_t
MKDPLNINPFVILSKWMMVFFLMIGIYFVIFPHDNHDIPVKIKLSEQLPDFDTLYQNCVPGVHGSIYQLQFRTLSITNRQGVSVLLPVYSTCDLNKSYTENPHNANITRVVIVQHGNLRNANNYFCSMVAALSSLAPQFLIDNDICWNQFTHEINTVRVSEGTTCGHPIWTSEGWKDGKLSLNVNNNNNVNNHNLFSYDVYNLLIERLSNKDYFPNIENIILFGFSAGAQLLLRYSILPQYHIINNDNIKVKFVISDPSTYLYLDDRRHFVNGSIGFDVPNQDWLPSSWKFDAQGQKWITSWVDDKCNAYNEWRYGLEKLDGYFSHNMPSPAHAIIN